MNFTLTAGPSWICQEQYIYGKIHNFALLQDVKKYAYTAQSTCPLHSDGIWCGNCQAVWGTDSLIASSVTVFIFSNWVLSQKPSESVSVDLLSLRPLKMIDCGGKIFPTAGVSYRKFWWKKNPYVFFVEFLIRKKWGEKRDCFFFFLPKLFALIYNVIVQWMSKWIRSIMKFSASSLSSVTAGCLSSLLPLICLCH